MSDNNVKTTPRTTCAECKFFRDLNSAWDHAGECRRFPPSSTGKHDRDGVETEFPKLTRDAWCGEFTPKQD